MKIDIELKLRYLETIQSVINRMCSNSSSLKGWAVATTSGVLVFASKGMNQNYIWLALIPSIIFMILDSYYLQCERKYRELYNCIQERDRVTQKELFSMKTFPSNRKAKTYYWQSLVSRSVLLFYGPLIVAIIGVSAVAPNYLK